MVFLTDENNQQLKSWPSNKYRRRRVCYKGDGKNYQNKQKLTEYRTPDRTENDLIFAIHNI
jgi:hypothetical protein